MTNNRVKLAKTLIDMVDDTRILAKDDPKNCKNILQFPLEDIGTVTITIGLTKNIFGKVWSESCYFVKTFEAKFLFESLMTHDTRDIWVESITINYTRDE